MITLSFSSLNLLHEASHQWLNKQMGIPVPEYDFFKEGKIAHKLIQAHVSGKTLHPDLSHITAVFPVVEEKEYDQRLKFKFNFKSRLDELNIKTAVLGDYEIIGYYDGLDIKNGRFLEIKSSSTLWTLGKFIASPQRKIYALSKSKLKEAYLITCSRSPQDWKTAQPRLFTMKVTDRDRVQAAKWIAQGIAILESGNFTGGLDENGKCKGCLWGNNCNFK